MKVEPYDLKTLLNYKDENLWNSPNILIHDGLSIQVQLVISERVPGLLYLRTSGWCGLGTSARR